MSMMSFFFFVPYGGTIGPALPRIVLALASERSVVSAGHHPTILGAFPIRVAGSNLTALENAYISFSHIVETGDTKTADIRYLSKLLLREASFTCIPRQRHIVIPIPHNPLHGKRSLCSKYKSRTEKMYALIPRTSQCINSDGD